VEFDNAGNEIAFPEKRESKAIILNVYTARFNALKNLSDGSW
jgi:hypothetical protein